MGSNHRLTLEERQKIEGLLHENYKHTDIANIIGIHPTTLYREFKKCKQGSYNAKEAHRNTCRGYHPIDWDIIGKKYGLLTVLNYVHKYNHRTWWKCKCDCGKFTIISRKTLADYCSDRRPLSCGCIAKQSKGRIHEHSHEESSLRKYQDLLNFRKKNGDCWNWTGYMQGGKTPKTSWKNKSMTVRKCMYMLVNGLIYQDSNVYTSCGNIFCFNPEHLTIKE